MVVFIYFVIDPFFFFKIPSKKYDVTGIIDDSQRSIIVNFLILDINLTKLRTLGTNLKITYNIK